MAARRQTRVDQDCITLVCVQCSPSLISDVEGRQDSAPVEEDGLMAVEFLVRAGSI